MPKCLHTTCPYCGVGCGVDVQVDVADAVTVLGDGNHPANAGRLCVKGTTLAETLVKEGRLLKPKLHKEVVDWDCALNTVADRLRHVIAEHGPQAVAFYLSGQLLTEDYYAANKLMKGFLGSANVDTNSRLCMSSAVAGYKRAFGEDVVPCNYEDLEACDLLVMVGSNAAWTHAILYQRIVASKAENQNKRVVVVDTRKTATCEVADLHLEVRPGSDGYLFGGLLQFLSAHGHLDAKFIAHCTENFSSALHETGSLSIEVVCEQTGLSPEALEQFYSWFATTEKTVTFYSQGVNQSATGTDKCNAIINCHLATGRIGQLGMGPFSITGQPNAMGGREVGGLANQLAAHMDFSDVDIDRVQRFWEAPNMARSPGLKAVDLFEAMANGEIKFVWIMATNPAVSLPNTARVTEALSRCDFVVVSDVTDTTETARFADLLLPAQPWGEKDGTVTNSERVISRQRAFKTAMGEAKPDWWIVSEVGKRLGFGEAFDYRGPADIFREHAALSGFENGGERVFDISELRDLSDEQFNTLEPYQWPRVKGGSARPFDALRFSTTSRRAQFVVVRPESPQTFPLSLNTGRVRDQWHTMTRTGLVPKLSRHKDFFSIDVCAVDAKLAGLEDGDIVRVSKADDTEHCIVGIAQIDTGLSTGNIFAPIHWSRPFANAARVSALMDSTTDPVSGQPASKLAGVKLERLSPRSWAMVLIRGMIDLEDVTYWSAVPVSAGWMYLVADFRAGAELITHLHNTLGVGESQPMRYEDSSSGCLNAIYTDQTKLVAALYVAPERAVLPEVAAIEKIFDQTGVDVMKMLSGNLASGPDRGRLICSCWEVGSVAIGQAIAGGCHSTEALSEKLRCGTQCGSCIPDLKAMLAASQSDEAA